MSERRALLDPDMYKISEEDSQDEEVLSSFNHLNINGINFIQQQSSFNSSSSGGSYSNENVLLPNPTAVPSRMGKIERQSHNVVPIQPPPNFSGPSPSSTSISCTSLSSDKSAPSSRVPPEKPVRQINTTKLAFHSHSLTSLSSSINIAPNQHVEWPESSESSSQYDDGSSSGTDGSGSESSVKRSGGIDGGGGGDGDSAHHTITKNKVTEDAYCSYEDDRHGSNKSHHRRHYYSSSSSLYSDYDDDDDDNEEDNGDYFDDKDQFFAEDLIDDEERLITESEIRLTTTGEGNVYLYEEDSKIPFAQDLINKSCSGSSKKTSEGSNDNDDSTLKENDSSTSSSKKAGKLGRLLKKKRKKGDGGKELIKSEQKSKAKHSNSSEGKEKVFRFKDEEEGEIRQVDVLISKTNNKYNFGRRGTPVESILGIIPGRFSSRNNIRQTNKYEVEDDRIMIAGLVPEGPAIRNRIKIGDWLQSIDGRMVNFSNINSVLSTIIKKNIQPVQQDPESPHIKLQLLIKRVAGTLIEDEKDISKQDIKRIGLDTENPYKDKKYFLSKVQNELSDEVLSQVVVLFISSFNTPSTTTTSTTRSGNKQQQGDQIKDVLFVWPRPDMLKSTNKKKVEALVGSQGMFSTLYRLLRDVTTSHPVISRVKIDDDVINVSFSSDNGDSLLLLAISDKLHKRCYSTMSSLMKRLETVLIFKWGTLTRAFTEASEIEMGRYLSNILASLIDTVDEYLFVELPSPYNLTISTRMSIDEVLYAFEASTFVLSEMGEHSKSEASHFHCIGSVLYFKRKEVHSHLKRDLKERFYIWMLTEMNEWAAFRRGPTTRIALWQKTFPPGSNNNDNNDQNDSSVHSSRSPLRISVLVGIGYFLLGFVLETTVTSQKCEQAEFQWLQRAMNVLKVLIMRDLGTVLDRRNKDKLYQLYPEETNSADKNSKKVEKKESKKELKKKKDKKDLEAPGVVNTGSSSSILKNSKSRARQQSVFTISSHQITKQENQHHHHHHEKMISNFPLEDGQRAAMLDSSIDARDKNLLSGYDAGGSGEKRGGDLTEVTVIDDCGTTGAGTASGAGSFHRNVSPRGEGGGGSEQIEGNGNEALGTTCVMKGNVLFDFVQIEYGRGVVLSQGDLRETLEKSGSYSEVVQNFRQCVNVTHLILQKALRSREKLRDNDVDKKWVSKTMAPITEHGVLFHCELFKGKPGKKKTRKNTKIINYWVVGRIFQNRELYVCYQDTPDLQNFAEIAFKLAQFNFSS